MAKKRRYSGVKKPRSKDGKYAMILAVISAAAFLACIIISCVFKGQGGLVVGAIGLGGFLIALYGCVNAFKVLSKKKNSHRLTYSAAICCGLMTLLWVAVCLAGVK